MYLDMTTHQAIEHRMFTPKDSLSGLDESRVRAADRAFRRVDVICASTPWAARSVVEEHGVPSAKVHAVGIGARPLDASRQIRDFSTPKYLFVGTRWERKNGPTVLAAFRRLREEHPSATLDIVGEHPDLKEPGVSTHGFLARDNAEHQRKLADLYGRATCLVLPGAFEAAGIVFIEASHQGIPSICGDVGGAADLVGSGGVAVPPGDVSALHAAMRAMVGTPGERMGLAASKRADLFTWPSVARRILESLNSEQPSDNAGMWEA
ncbi:glycosyltransferase family 4 protein [Brachybacterium aquaticum]|nr:glycosyltransferase family 4 protein [Brachybacterium aquaticum]